MEDETAKVEVEASVETTVSGVPTEAHASTES